METLKTARIEFVETAIALVRFVHVIAMYIYIFFLIANMCNIWNFSIKEGLVIHHISLHRMRS